MFKFEKQIINFLKYFIGSSLFLFLAFFNRAYALPDLVTSRITVCRDPQIVTRDGRDYARFFIQVWERNIGDSAAGPHSVVIGAGMYSAVRTNYCGFFNYPDAVSRQVDLNDWLPAGTERWVFSGWFEVPYLPDDVCFQEDPIARYGFGATVDGELDPVYRQLYRGCATSDPGDVLETNDTLSTQGTNNNLIVYGNRSFCFSEIPVCSFLTPTPTPTLMPWKKVKNASFSDPFGGVFSNDVPDNPLPFDSDDTGEPFFAFGEDHGVVTVDTYNNPSELSSLSRYITSYAASTSYPGISSVNSFIVYMKGNKTFQTVQPDVAGNLDITAEGLYLVEDPGVEVAPVDPPSSNYVLVVDGSVLITAQDGEFNVDPASDTPFKKIIILADTITFSSELTKAYGIFIGNNISIPFADFGLKIKGNLVALKSFSFSRSYLPENLKPALFVVFDHTPYFDLLEYISVRKVEREEF